MRATFIPWMTWQTWPAYRFLHADVRDAELMRRTMKEYSPDWVMHLAAESHVDRSIDDPGDFITTNVMGTFSMLQASLDYYRSLEGERKQRFRFHHISTDEVYGTLGRDGLVYGSHAVQPPFPVFLQQGGQRPSGARLARYVRPARTGHELLQ